jgi:thiopurine S-methyltransferase
MLLEHWHDRWRRNEIGFHQDIVNPYLIRHWPELGLDAGAPVFVPLCGKSRDMLWLHDRGHPVVGVEISPIAVKDFFAENNLTARPLELPPFAGWAGDGVKILCGDFFDLTPDHLAGTRGMYDRASLIALPEESRRRYAEHLSGLIRPRVPVLLVTLDYPVDEMAGPPFAVREEEVHDLYERCYTVRLLESRQVLDDNPRFREKGLTRLQETVYHLVPRG